MKFQITTNFSLLGIIIREEEESVLSQIYTEVQSFLKGKNRCKRKV
jgi:hypothetical protein